MPRYVRCSLCNDFIAKCAPCSYQVLIYIHVPENLRGGVVSTADFPSRTTYGGSNFSPLTRKLLNFAALSAADQQALDALANSAEVVDRNTTIAEEGEVPRAIVLITRGMAVRSRALVDGGRQILTFMIPGDICDLDVFLLRARDHSIFTLSEACATSISRDGIGRLLHEHPQVAVALRRSALQEQSMLRERVVALGRRDARSRLAYLLCELFWRHEAMGVTDEMFHLPLTQEEFGDSLGLTQVHVNRTIRELRERNLIAVQHRKVVLLDVEGLQKVAEIDRDYLDLAKAGVPRRGRLSPGLPA